MNSGIVAAGNVTGKDLAVALSVRGKALAAKHDLDKAIVAFSAAHDADPDNNGPVPVDLVTASASGLDPEISPAAAEYQASRVARLRNLPLTTVQALITQHQQRALFDILGEARVNVLELNLALDSLR